MERKGKMCLLAVFLPLFVAAFAEPAAKRAVALTPRGQDLRTALVIGNAAYESGRLKNAVNDASDMAKVLGDSGFEVILRTDADLRTMEDAVFDFGRRLAARGGTGLFYYAGHGIQSRGVNYLIPIGARIESESDLRYASVDAGRVLGKMQDAGNEVNIVFLDACRNDPFARSFRSAEKGLARMDAPTGSFVAYATAPGEVAADGEARNGVFTQHLMENMQKPGLKVEDVLKSTRLGVMQATAKKQVPWDSSSLTGNFYFFSGGGVKDIVTPQTVALALPPKAKDIGDFAAVIKSREEAKEKWADWQKEMLAEFGKAEGYDQSAFLLPEEKLSVWGNFLMLYAADNPYAEEDKSLRERALARQAHWQGLRGQKALQSPPPVAGMPAAVMPVAQSLVTSPAEARDFEFVWLKGACYQMGQTDNEKERMEKNADEKWYRKNVADELPRHEVCVDGFWMGKHEVTVGQWQRFVTATGYQSDAEKNAGGKSGCFSSDDQKLNTWDGSRVAKVKKWDWVAGRSWRDPGFPQSESLPVACVSSMDVEHFLVWLNGSGKEKYRLPTEAEWEFAARAGSHSAWFWGDLPDDQSCRFANVGNDVFWPRTFACDDGYRWSSPVGSLLPNPFALHDMLGNVREWSGDWYDKDYYARSPRENPRGPTTGLRRSVRGGSWHGQPWKLRSADREGEDPDYRASDLGFRLLRLTDK